MVKMKNTAPFGGHDSGDFQKFLVRLTSKCPFFCIYSWFKEHAVGHEVDPQKLIPLRLQVPGSGFRVSTFCSRAISAQLRQSGQNSGPGFQSRVLTYIYEYIHIYICIYMYTLSIYICTFIYMYVYVYIYIYIYPKARRLAH